MACRLWPGCAAHDSRQGNDQPEHRLVEAATVEVGTSAVIGSRGSGGSFPVNLDVDCLKSLRSPSSSVGATSSCERHATPSGRNRQSKESEDTAFEQWAAPYRELHIPLVSMEVVESYNPSPIPPILPDDFEINQ